MAVALLLAAGRGERLGAAVPKAFVELARKPLLQWSLDVLAGCDVIDRIVLALPPNAEAPQAVTSRAAVPPGVRLPADVVCVPGAEMRSGSVARALATAGPGDLVLVHDAARPLLTAELVERTLRALDDESIECAIAAAPVTDTIKQASGDPPIVAHTLDRSGLWAVQTPQVFRRGSLERALAVPEEVLAQATDDAWLLERAGGRIAIVPSSARNLKVTTTLDLKLAELLLSAG
jgi:2-C-methyl-D-erythritol 4-phosphate cytidylyltransferase